MEGSRKYGCEPSGYTKFGEFHDYVSEYQLL